MSNSVRDYLDCVYHDSIVASQKKAYERNSNDEEWRNRTNEAKKGYGAVWSTYEEYRNHANSNNKARNHDAASGPRNKASNKRSRRRIEEEWPGENAPRYQDWSQLQTPGAEAQRSKDYQKKQKINSKQTSAKLGLTVGSTSNDPTRRARSTS